MHFRKQTVTAVATALILGHEVDVRAGMKMLAIAISVPVGGQAINDVEIRGQIGEKEVLLVSTTAEFTATSPKPPLLGASGDINAIAANANGWCLLAVAPFSKISVYVKCAGAGPTNITIDSESDDFAG